MAPPGKPAGDFYTAVPFGQSVEFWDADVILFTVPACLAQNQQQRDAIAALWDLAIEEGRNQGREKLKLDLLQVLDA